MKTEHMTIYKADSKGLIDKGAVVIVKTDEGFFRLHECSSLISPRRYTCKLELDGSYHKEELDTTHLVIVVTGD